MYIYNILYSLQLWDTASYHTISSTMSIEYRSYIIVAGEGTRFIYVYTYI